MKGQTTSVRSGLRESLTTGLTLLSLAGVGYLGHHTGWSFTGGHAGTTPQADSHAAAAPSEDSPSDPTRVRFPSIEAIHKSGVTLVQPETRAIIEFVEANAVVTYDERHVSQISSRVSGTVRSVHKRWGDVVRKGDLLAVVEGVEVGKLKAEFLNNLALNETRSATLDLLREASQSLPANRIREAELQVREAYIRLHNAEQTLINLGLPLKVAEFAPLSDEERARKIQFLGFPEAMIAGMDRDASTTNLAPMIAPFDGVVIGRDAGIGEWTEPSKMLFEVADIRSMWLKLDVQKEDAAKIRLGQLIYFHGDGMEQELACEVSWISTEVNQETRTLQVRADVQNPVLTGTDPDDNQRLLRANTFGTARIQVRENSQALVLPQECIQTDTDEDMVFIQQGDRTFQAVPVQVGVTDGNFVEVCGAISVGDEVACKGSHVIKSQLVLNRLGAGE
jgi:multidrug efflux pump subunit AcrA (membrane-fusion protein)